MRRGLFPRTVTALCLAFFYLPILVLVINSLNGSRYGGRWGGLSLKWYRLLFSDERIWLSARNTLIVALIATVVSMVLGTAAALALHRHRGRLQDAHYALVFTPLVVPDILMGMSLLLFFVTIAAPLGIVTITLAHITFCVSYVAMVVLARLQDFDDALIEAAHDLGAGHWTTFRRVVLPLLMPGIAAGGLLAFTLSVDDFVISFFVAGPGSSTLPIQVYSMIRHGNPPVINALSTLLLILTVAVVWSCEKLMGRNYADSSRT
ncbi:MAG: ABC transporter permease [Lentisphaerae bacterium]|nr:ABC transporter permease [Lentisphaerota bacterium]